MQLKTYMFNLLAYSARQENTFYRTRVVGLLTISHAQGFTLILSMTDPEEDSTIKIHT
jgi:hypothetical protein